MVWGSFKNPSDPWGSGPRGFDERSRCTNEFFISLLLSMQFASVVAAGERRKEGEGKGNFYHLFCMDPPYTVAYTMYVSLL